MAASSTSTVLGLSLWAQTDCPEWADFLQDNQKLEQLAGELWMELPPDEAGEVQEVFAL